MTVMPMTCRVLDDARTSASVKRRNWMDHTAKDKDASRVERSALLSNRLVRSHAITDDLDGRSRGFTDCSSRSRFLCSGMPKTGPQLEVRGRGRVSF